MGPFGHGTNYCAFSVPKYGWASSRNTPEPHTATKLLHKRDYRISSKSPAADAIKIDSPAGDTPTMEPPRSATPCPRSFTPTSQPKMPNKRELPVKFAEILTQTGCQSRPTNLSRETYVIMKKALQGTQRAGRTRNDVRDSKQRVWKYVTNLSSNGRASVTPTGKITVVLTMDTSKKGGHLRVFTQCSILKRDGPDADENRSPFARQRT